MVETGDWRLESYETDKISFRFTLHKPPTLLMDSLLSSISTLSDEWMSLTPSQLESRVSSIESCIHGLKEVGGKDPVCDFSSVLPSLVILPPTPQANILLKSLPTPSNDSVIKSLLSAPPSPARYSLKNIHFYVIHNIEKSAAGLSPRFLLHYPNLILPPHYAKSVTAPDLSKYMSLVMKKYPSPELYTLATTLGHSLPLALHLLSTQTTTTLPQPHATKVSTHLALNLDPSFATRAGPASLPSVLLSCARSGITPEVALNLSPSVPYSHACGTWSDATFLLSSSLVQEGITEVIIACIAGGYGGWDDKLTEGVSLRLESSVEGVRRMGMRVAECAAWKMGQDLSFDELGKGDRTWLGVNDVEIREDAGAATTEVVAASGGDVVDGLADLDDDSSDSESDLAIAPRPMYLRTALSYLRSPEADPDLAAKTDAALESIPKLTSERPPDLPLLAVDLCKDVLHLENRFDSEEYQPMRALALSSLASSSPINVVPYLSSEAFGENMSLGTRLEAIDAIVTAAEALSGRDAPQKKALPTPGTRQKGTLPSSPSDSLQKTNRWSSRTPSKSQRNDFAPHTILFFSSLATSLKQSNPKTWSDPSSSLLLSRVLLALSSFVALTVPHIRVGLSPDLFRTCWSFRLSSDPVVRRSAIAGMQVAAGGMNVGDLFALLEGSEGEIEEWLAGVTRGDEDDDSREAAGGLLMDIQRGIRGIIL